MYRIFSLKLLLSIFSESEMRRGSIAMLIQVVLRFNRNVLIPALVFKLIITAAGIGKSSLDLTSPYYG